MPNTLIMVYSNKKLTNGSLTFEGILRDYWEITFSGFASSPAPYDIIKVQTSPDNSAWTDLSSYTLTASSGTIKTISPSLPKDMRWIRLKAYDSDGTTALTASGHTNLFRAKIIHVSASPSDTLGDARRNVARLVDNNLDEWGFSDRLGKYNDKDILGKSISSFYEEIEAEDSGIIQRTAITAGMTANGISNYPSFIQTQMTNNLNWCSLGTNMSTPNWVLDGFVYTFSSNQAAAKCEDALVAKIGVTLIEKELEHVVSGGHDHGKLSDIKTVLGAIATEKIEDIT